MPFTVTTIAAAPGGNAPLKANVILVFDQLTGDTVAPPAVNELLDCVVPKSLPVSVINVPAKPKPGVTVAIAGVGEVTGVTITL